MMSNRFALRLLNQAPLILLLIIFAVLGSLSREFLAPQNFVNILIQSSSIAVAAIGMTLVLLTAGVDLSIGSLMFVSVAVAGKLVAGGFPIWVAFAIGIGIGILGGAINAFLITYLGLIAFIATLGMLFVERGFGLWLTNTRAMNMPDTVTELGSSRLLGIPFPIVVMGFVAIAAHWFLTNTATGRQIYAIGSDIEAAKKAGIRVLPILFLVYLLCGMCAAISGLIALTQTGAVSPSFGQQKEFAAIAAAVLGGTSLFGGRGNILPGTIFGAILFQTIENGLVVVNADPYLYPMILSATIFLAVLLDTTRSRFVQAMIKRHIRVEKS